MQINAWNMNRRRFLIAGLTATLATACSTTPALTQPARRRARRQLRRIRRRAIRRFRQRGGLPSDARDAVRRGDVRPLRDVLALVRRRSDAEILDVDLYQRPQGWVYALRLLTVRGRVRDVFLSARTLEPLSLSKDKGIHEGVPLPPELAPSRPAQPGGKRPPRK